MFDVVFLIHLLKWDCYIMYDQLLIYRIYEDELCLVRTDPMRFVWYKKGVCHCSHAFFDYGNVYVLIAAIFPFLHILFHPLVKITLIIPLTKYYFHII